jgi:hypothetical protein
VISKGGFFNGNVTKGRAKATTTGATSEFAVEEAVNA